MSQLFPGTAFLSSYAASNSSILGKSLISSSLSSLTASGGNSFKRRQQQYIIGRAAYEGTIFKDNRKWERYLSERDLHPKTICLINPTQRLCDFYASHLYPGYLSPTGYPDAANVSLSIPIVNADEELKSAIAQLWTWGNWANAMHIWIRTCASLGDGPIEIVDNVVEGRVYAKPVEPEWITDVKTDDIGNVIYYVKQNQAWDPETDEYYEYVRVVDRKTISTYRNGQPYGYNGAPATYDNPYGFVPLVWCKHKDPGANIFPGLPAIRDWGKIEEVNSDIARVRGLIRRLALTPQLLAGMGEINPYITEEDGSMFDFEDTLFMTASEKGTLFDIKGNLSITESLDEIALIRQEIEADHPELKAHSDFTNMSQATGPATQNILGNITNLVSLASKPYDKATVDVHKMMVAIAGHRANEGKLGWAKLNYQQQKFLPYSLESMDNGQLEFAISPREIATMTEYDLAETDRQKFIAMAASSRAGYPIEMYLKDKGWKEEEINNFLDKQEKQFQRELKRAQLLQEASNGASASLIPQFGKDSTLSGNAIVGTKKSESGEPGSDKPKNPGSQTTEGNSTAKSITSQQVN